MAKASGGMLSRIWSSYLRNPIQRDLKSIYLRILGIPFVLLTLEVIALFIYTEFLVPDEYEIAIYNFVLYTTPILLLISAYHSYHVAGGIARPLIHLLRKIRRYPDSYNHRIPAPDIEEIHELYVRVNEFMERMNNQIRDLNLEKELFRSLLNGLQEGVLCVDMDGVIIFQNNNIDSDLVEPDSTGLSYFRGVKNSTILELIHSHLESQNKIPPVRQVNLAYRNAFFTLTILPIIMEKRLEQFLIIIHDKTREEGTRRLREDFLQNASHELKTPITSIRGYSEMLQNRLTDPRDQAHIDTILRNVGRMESLIGDMVTISSLESGRYPFHPEKIHIRSYIDDVKELIAGNLNQKHQTLEIQVDDAHPEIHADPLLMEHLLLNLLSNASRYSPDSTTITLTFQANEKGSGHLISVADQGPGIAEDYRDKVFERFFRVDRDRSRREGGTGLGLSIVRQITRIHGGRVWIEDGDNGGSLFKVWLPE